jgi:peptidoglycan hydrolase FlgJ
MLGPQGISPATTLSTPPGVKAGATVKGAADAKLINAAKEMEATFLSMLLKEMRQTLDQEEGGGLFPGDSGDVQGGLFDLYMSKHLADSGGVGMAAALVQQMQAGSPAKAAPTTDALIPPAATSNEHAPPAPRS